MNKNQHINALKTAKGIGAAVVYTEQNHIPHTKIKAGSLVGKIPIRLADGRTTIYCYPEKEAEVRKNWENRING